jgi:rare lipoprotein A (peptidoglycan hydrolase)
MQRFRTRRRRAAAILLPPLAAITATTALAGTAGAENDSARIDASARNVPYGAKLTLRGSFPGAERAAIEIRHRANGARSWRTVTRARTGADGRYVVRVEPRRSGRWRAELAGELAPQSAPDGGAQAAANPSTVDEGTGTEQVSVRSRTKAAVSTHHTLAGRTVKVRGKVTPAGAERRVVVRIGRAKEATTAGRDGRFDVTWRAPETGSYPVRVKARTNRVATGSRDSAGRVTAYREALASWYGPGFYGGTTACGGTLTPSTLGVAHKTLPCGTKLRLRYRGRSVAVRVIDRGPYSGSREFDLTSATKQRLRFGDVGTVLTSK